MNLADILSPAQIVPNLSAADRWGVIDQLIDLLTRTGKLRPEDREPIRKIVRDREASKSTGIGYGVALPHASVPSLPAVVAAFARLNPPLDFQALDSQPVRLCLLFLTPQGQFQQHLHTLSTIARFLSIKDNRHRLENAQTAEEIMAVFQAPS